MQSIIVNKWTKPSADDWTIPAVAGKSIFFDGFNGDKPQCFAVVVPRQTNRLVTFQCEWVDQGWGERHGQILIVAQDRPSYMNSKLLALPLGKGEVVAKSSIVKHTKSKLTVPFYPKQNKIYQLYCTVGSQWYSTMRLENISVQRLLMKNPIPTWSMPKCRAKGRLESLPSELVERVIGYLPTSDTLHLIQTCKAMSRDIDLFKVTSLLTKKSVAEYPRSCFAVIIPKMNSKIHAASLQCNIRSEKWSNSMEGRLMVVEHDRKGALNVPDEEELDLLEHYMPFGEGKIVAKTKIFEDHKAALSLSFYPRSDKIYQLWLIDKGSKSQLKIENMKLHVLGFGSESTACETFFAGFADDASL